MQAKMDTPNFDFWMLMNDPEHETKAEAAAVIARLDEVIAEPFELSPYAVMLLADEGNRRRDKLRCEAIRAQAYVARQRAKLERDKRWLRHAFAWLAACIVFGVGMWLVAR